MKVLASAVLLSAMGATQATVSVMDSRQVTRMIRRQLLPASATAEGAKCASNAPCSSNNCLAVAGIASMCSPMLGETLVTIAHPGASDGHSMGIAALMLDAEMDEASDAAVCNAWKANNWTTSCVQPTPFHAILNSLEWDIGGKCTGFKNIIFEAFGVGAEPVEEEEEEGEGWTPTAPASAPQKAVIHAVASQIFSANMTSALTGVGLSWGDFLGPVVGLLPTSEDEVVAAIAGTAYTCAQAYVEDEEDGDVADLIMDFIINQEDYASDDAKMAAVTAFIQERALNEYAGQLFDVVQNLDISNAFMDVILATAEGQSAEDIVAAQDQLTQVVTNWGFFITEFNSSPVRQAIQLTVGQVKVGLNTVEDLTWEFFGSAEEGAACNQECGELALTVTLMVLNRLATMQATLNFEGEYAMANITAIANADPAVPVFAAFPSYMEECFSSKRAVFEGEVLVFLRAMAGGQLAASEMQKIMGGALSIGCNLFKMNLTANGDPSIVNRGSCYVLPILMSSTASQTFMAIKDGTLTPELIFPMRHSTENVKARCDAAGVALGTFPTYVEPAPTARPTTQTTSAPVAPTVLDAGAGSFQPLIALVIVAVAFLF